MREELKTRQPNAHWLERWEQNNIGWHHQAFNQHLMAHWSALDFQTGGRVLLPLCGKSLDMVWLAQRGYSVLGVELSPLAVEAFFQERRLTAQRCAAGAFESWRAGPYEILCGDIFALDGDRLQDVASVYDRASLVALNPNQRLRYARLLAELLPEETPVLLVSMDYPQQEMQGPPYSVPDQQVRELFSPNFSVEQVHALNLLQDSKRYRDKGLSNLWEGIYRLRRL